MAFISYILIIYSFIGFILETLFAFFVRHKKEDRKTLYFLPMCPVYGFGALVLHYVLQISDNPLIIILLSIVAGSTVEYIYEFLCRKLFSVSLWNYSKSRLNCKGLICLPFSVMWGALGLLFYYIFDPLTVKLFKFIPTPLIYLATIFFVADIIVTIYNLCYFKRHTDRAELLCSVMKSLN